VPRLITRGLAEMSRLGVALGARAETFMGLTGLGDLILTATGDLSRNRQVGLALGRGRSLDQVVAELGHVAEGVRSAEAVLGRARTAGVQMPISEAVFAVLSGRLTAAGARSVAGARPEERKQVTLKSVCVFCGSQQGARAEYLDAVRDLARACAARGLLVIYGGGHVGMMGALADEMLANNGRIVGIIPRHLMRSELAHRGLTELNIVESMHDRKRAMAERSDAFVVPARGYAPSRKTFEMVTRCSCGCNPPVGIPNIEELLRPAARIPSPCRVRGHSVPEHWDLIIVEHGVELPLDRLELRSRNGAQPSATTRSVTRLTQRPVQ
jgi:uncharacterized protein (TIGR00730 family)